MKAGWLVCCEACDEWWCGCCEAECPVCLVGAGVETGVAVCSHCGERFCGECVQALSCAQCAEPICGECWTGGISLCMTCWGGAGDNEEEPSGLELPPGFSLVPESEFRSFENKDREAWRETWVRTRKTPIWKEKTSGE